MAFRQVFARWSDGNHGPFDRKDPFESTSPSPDSTQSAAVSSARLPALQATPRARYPVPDIRPTAFEDRVHPSALQRAG